MEIITNVALISINETLIVQLVSFLVFMLIMKKIMYTPLRSAIGERETYIEDIRRDISDAQKKIDQYQKDLARKRSKVQDEAFEVQRQIENAGQKEADKIFEATRENVQALKQNIQKEIDAEITEARKGLETESNLLATQIMEKILDRRLVS